MKSLRFFSIVVLTFVGGAVFAQSKTDSIKVLGNCGMCKKRIETALKVPGVTSADWNVKSKMLTVNYEPSKLTLNEVQQKIADAGHDTPKYKATDAVYSKLPGCCQYERAGETSKQTMTDHKH